MQNKLIDTLKNISHLKYESLDLGETWYDRLSTAVSLAKEALVSESSPSTAIREEGHTPASSVDEIKAVLDKYSDTGQIVGIDFTVIVYNDAIAAMQEYSQAKEKEIEGLKEEIQEYKNDLKEAADELLIEIPHPHSIMAKVVSANSILRQQVGNLQSQLTAKEAEIDSINRSREYTFGQLQDTTAKYLELQRQLKESLLLYNNQTETIAKRDAELRKFVEAVKKLYPHCHEVNMKGESDYERAWMNLEKLYLKNQKPNSEPEVKVSDTTKLNSSTSDGKTNSDKE